MEHLAIDLGGRKSQLCLRNSEGQILTEAKVVLAAGKDARELLEQTTVEMNDRTLTITSPRQGGIFDLPMFGPQCLHPLLPRALQRRGVETAGENQHHRERGRET